MLHEKVRYWPGYVGWKKWNEKNICRFYNGRRWELDVHAPMLDEHIAVYSLVMVERQMLPVDDTRFLCLSLCNNWLNSPPKVVRLRQQMLPLDLHQLCAERLSRCWNGIMDWNESSLRTDELERYLHSRSTEIDIIILLTLCEKNLNDFWGARRFHFSATTWTEPRSSNAGMSIRSDC